MAISLFWDNGGELVGGQTNNSASVNSSRPSSIHSNEVSDHTLTDEEFARQMQAREEVRAPIAPKTDILAGGGGGGGMFQPVPSRWNRDHSKKILYMFYLVS
jgi:hypothetical protein